MALRLFTMLGARRGLDPASGLTIVGQITPQNNTQIAGSTDLSDPIAMAVFTHGETDGQGNPIAGTLLPPLNQNAAGNAAYPSPVR